MDMLERARRVRDLDGLGRVELTTASEAMAQIRAEGDDADLPVWVGELYLEFHRGTYTTHGAVKKGNRKLEGSLRDAEVWALGAYATSGRPIPTDALERAWKKLLLHQFHDIIPGSSIHWVYQDTMADYAEIRATTDQIVNGSLEEIASNVDPGSAERPVLVANGLGWPRDEVVDVAGELHRVTAPACGWAVNDLANPAPPEWPPADVGRWLDGQRTTSSRVGRRRIAALGATSRDRPRSHRTRQSREPAPAAGRPADPVGRLGHPAHCVRRRRRPDQGRHARVGRAVRDARRAAGGAPASAIHASSS